MNRVSLLSLAALGILAYIAETLLHELGGHGIVCLLSGGHIVLLAPLYMRCSIVTTTMVAAGPAMNFLVGLLCFLVLRISAKENGVFRYFLWLSLCFNWLVAAGYLIVGAATGFGDWPVIFAQIHPSWMWRAAAGVTGIAAYFLFLRIAGGAFLRIAGLENPDRKTLARLILVPTTAAAIVALAAEAYGQGAKPLGLALAFGCTLFVGLTLMGIDGRADAPATLRMPLNIALVALGLLAGVGFVAFIGPGADLSAL